MEAFFDVNNAVLDLIERAYRDVLAMDEWAAACGAQRAEGIQLTSSDDHNDVSLLPTQDLPADTPVLFLPAAMILSSQPSIPARLRTHRCRRTTPRHTA